MLVEEGGLRRDGDRWVLPGLGAARVDPALPGGPARGQARPPAAGRTRRAGVRLGDRQGVLDRRAGGVAAVGAHPGSGWHPRSPPRPRADPSRPWRPSPAARRTSSCTCWSATPPTNRSPKATRADLHERFAAWLETSLGPRAEEYQEIVGYHLGQAHRYLRELGSQDPRLDDLAAHAADRLGAAGRRAAARGDAPAAQRLLERAADLSPEPAVRADDRLRMLGSLLDSGGAARAPSILRLARDDVDGGR